MADADETSMQERLGAFLARFDGKPVTWGADDCTASTALWLRENGIDISIPLYSSREEAHALVAAAGGLVALWDRELARVGLYGRGSVLPEVGDIAVIDTRTFGQVGVLCGAGGLCCWRKEGGFFWLTPRSFVKVWTIS